MRSRSLATRSAPTISRRSTAIGWRRAMVSTALSSISCCSASIAAVGRDHALGALDIALGQRVDGIRDLLLGEAAHLRDHAAELLQVDVEGLGGVFGHGISLSSQHPALHHPKRPVM